MGRKAGQLKMPIAFLDARQNFSAETLPPSLSRIRLSRRTPLGAARFFPDSEEEALLGIFASWNMLDAQMYAMTRLLRNESEMYELKKRHGNSLPASYGREHVARHHLWQAGYLREVQLRRMVQLIRSPGVQRYCEVGMNGGHSATAMLLANPTVQADVFDWMRLKYSKPAAELLSASFSARFALHPGGSGEVLPEWTRKFRAKGLHCDVVLVDGSHEEVGAASDLRWLGSVSNAETRVVIDDINMSPGRALASEVAAKRVEVLEQYGPFDRGSKHNPCMRVPDRSPPRLLSARKTLLCPKWGFAVARFLMAPPRRLP